MLLTSTSVPGRPRERGVRSPAMSSLSRSLARSVVRSLGWDARDAVQHRGFVLPPKRSRLGGEHFKDDDAFLESGRREAERLTDRLDLSDETRLLDVGCGFGRLPVGLLAHVGEMRDYAGIDVNPACIHWCARHIERAHPGFRFRHIDIANPRYNPGGEAARNGLPLPFTDGAFDAIYLYSVFSHMVIEDVDLYLADFYRLLAPGGRAFLTAFVEDEVPEMSINPEGYRRQWGGELHCVRYERTRFLERIRRHGFEMTELDYAAETDGQSGLYLERRA